MPTAKNSDSAPQSRHEQQFHESGQRLSAASPVAPCMLKPRLTFSRVNLFFAFYPVDAVAAVSLCRDGDKSQRIQRNTPDCVAQKQHDLTPAIRQLAQINATTDTSRRFNHRFQPRQLHAETRESPHAEDCSVPDQPVRPRQSSRPAAHTPFLQSPAQMQECG